MAAIKPRYNNRHISYSSLLIPDTSNKVLMENKNTTRRSIAPLFYLALFSGTLFASSWSLRFVPFDSLVNRYGELFGADFVQFYILGHSLKTDPSSAYNFLAEYRDLHLFAPQLSSQTYLPLWYPPIVGIPFKLISSLPYLAQYILFVTFALIFCARGLNSLLAALNFPVSHWQTIGCSLLIPPSLETAAGGQLSFLGCGIVSYACTALVKGNPERAGAFLALGLYKPNMLIWFLIGVIFRWPRIILGMLPVAAIMYLLPIFMFGYAVTDAWLHNIVMLLHGAINTGTPPNKVMSWNSIFHGSSPMLGAALALLFIYLLTFTKFRSTISIYEYLSSLLVANSLFNLYTPIYDLILLIPAFLLWQVKKPLATRHFSLVTTLALGPHISQTFFPFVGFQIFPLILVALLAAILIHNCYERTAH
jgi:Glycosyltransferase family 87